jgi:hypothetical protein
LPGAFQDDVKPRLGLEHLALPPPLPEYATSGSGRKEASRPARIACWVMTSPRNHALKAVVVNNTWGSQCDILLFMTTQHQAGLPTVVLSLGEKEDRIYLWRKSIMAWTFLYKHLLDRADWFVRADDDTVLNMDNLRAYLASKPGRPVGPSVGGPPSVHAGLRMPVCQCSHESGRSALPGPSPQRGRRRFLLGWGHQRAQPQCPAALG